MAWLRPRAREKARRLERGGGKTVVLLAPARFVNVASRRKIFETESKGRGWCAEKKEVAHAGIISAVSLVRRISNCHSRAMLREKDYIQDDLSLSPTLFPSRYWHLFASIDEGPARKFQRVTLIDITTSQ